MIQEFVDRFMEKESQSKLRELFSREHIYGYDEIVRAVIEVIGGDDYDAPDPSRIHVINDGDYQGTLVYVIGARGYQPNRYWYCKVYYGSCSGCDTLAAINESCSDKPTDQDVEDYMTLALHIVQGMKEMGEE